MGDFERADVFTQRAEGGYVWNPLDIGHETNLGVTAATWQKWCVARGLPQKAMRNLTRADVTPLYFTWYWLPLAAGLPWPLSAAIYDMYVNHSPPTAEYLLSQARAAGGTPLSQALAAVDAREAMFRAIVSRNASQGVFLKGWLKRCENQRQWLKANADGQQAGTPPIFMRDKMGNNTVWDGKPTVYAGQGINPPFIAALRQWAAPGLTRIVGGLRVTVYPDLALQFDRV